jgi:hypothetical protein
MRLDTDWTKVVDPATPSASLEKTAWDVTSYEVVDPDRLPNNGAVGEAYVTLQHDKIAMLLGNEAWEILTGDTPALGWGIKFEDESFVEISANSRNYELSEDSTDDAYLDAIRETCDDWTVWFPTGFTTALNPEQAKELYRRLIEIFGDGIMTYDPLLKSVRVSQASMWDVVPEECSLEEVKRQLKPFQIWQSLANPHLRLFLGDDVSITKENNGYYFAVARGLARPAELLSDLVNDLHFWGIHAPYRLIGTWSPRTASLSLPEPKTITAILRPVEAWDLPDQPHPAYLEMSGKTRGPRTREQRRMPGAATKMHYDQETGGMAIRYHSTDVVTFYPQYVKLDTGGWSTMTTHARMREYLQQAHIPIGISRKDWESVMHNYNDNTDTVLKTQALIDYGGHILANGVDDVDSYMEENPPTLGEPL